MAKAGNYSDYMKYGSNLFNFLSGAAPTPKSDDTTKSTYTQLVLEYANDIKEGKLTNSQLIQIIKNTNSDIEEARQILDYFLYTPTPKQLQELYDITETENLPIEKATNFLKYHKNVYGAVENINSGKESSPLSSKVLDLTSPTVTKENIKKFTKGVAIAREFMGHVNLTYEGNTCFMNSALQLLYHIPDFKEKVLAFNLNTEQFKTEFAKNKLEPLKALRGIFEDLDEAKSNGVKTKSIKIHLNPYFECLWYGPYINETDESFTKRMELDSGLFIELDYRAGETRQERYMRILEEKQGEIADPIEKNKIRRNYRNLLTGIGTKLRNKDGRRMQHDISQFIMTCILNKLDMPSTKQILSPITFTQETEYELQYQKDRAFDAAFPKGTIEEGTTVITYENGGISHIRKVKEKIATSQMINLNGVVQLYTMDKSKIGVEFQNMIDFEKYSFNTSYNRNFFNFTFGDNQQYKVDPSLATIKTSYRFPSTLNHLLLQINRSSFNKITGEGLKAENPVYINKLIKVENVIFECIGVACQGGGVDFGHYWYIWKNPRGEWWAFNDLEPEPNLCPEINSKSGFLDLQYGTYDLKKTSFVCVYKRSTLLERDFIEYRRTVTKELNGIYDLERLPILLTSELRKNKFDFTEMLTEEKERVYTKVEEDIGRPSSEWNKDEPNPLYYVTLLERLPQGEVEYRKFALKQLVKYKKNLIEYLQANGKLFAGEYELLPQLLEEYDEESTRTSREAEATREAVEKKKNNAEVAEEERIRTEKRKLAAKQRLAGENTAKKSIATKEDMLSLISNIGYETITAGEIKEIYKTSEINGLVIQIQQQINIVRQKGKNPPALRVLLNTQAELIKHLQTIDTQTDSKYISNLRSLNTIFDPLQLNGYLQGGARIKTRKGKGKQKKMKKTRQTVTRKIKY
jgi:hypothetical protein